MYKIENNTDGILSLGSGDARNDFEQCKTEGVILDEIQIETRAYQQVQNLIDLHKKDIAPSSREELTDDPQKFSRLYVQAYKRRFMGLLESKKE